VSSSASATASGVGEVGRQHAEGCRSPLSRGVQGARRCFDQQHQGAHDLVEDDLLARLSTQYFVHRTAIERTRRSDFTEGDARLGLVTAPACRRRAMRWSADYSSRGGGPRERPPRLMRTSRLSDAGPRRRAATSRRRSRGCVRAVGRSERGCHSCPRSISSIIGMAYSNARSTSHAQSQLESV